LPTFVVLKQLADDVFHLPILLSAESSSVTDRNGEILHPVDRTTARTMKTLPLGRVSIYATSPVGHPIALPDGFNTEPEQCPNTREITSRPAVFRRERPGSIRCGVTERRSTRAARLDDLVCAASPAAGEW